MTAPERPKASVSVFSPAVTRGDDDDLLKWWATIETPDGDKELDAWSLPELLALIDHWAGQRGLRIASFNLTLEARP